MLSVKSGYLEWQLAIGTGVIGLPIAVMLTQNKFRPNVTLIAAEFSPNITAYAAGASLHV